LKLLMIYKLKTHSSSSKSASAFSSARQRRLPCKLTSLLAMAAEAALVMAAEAALVMAAVVALGSTLASVCFAAGLDGAGSGGAVVAVTKSQASSNAVRGHSELASTATQKVAFFDDAQTIVVNGKAYRVVETHYPNGRLRSQIVVSHGFSSSMIDQSGTGVIDFWQINRGSTSYTFKQPINGRFQSLQVSQKKARGAQISDFLFSYKEKKYRSIKTKFEPYKLRYAKDPSCDPDKDCTLKVPFVPADLICRLHEIANIKSSPTADGTNLDNLGCATRALGAYFITMGDNEESDVVTVSSAPKAAAPKAAAMTANVQAKFANEGDCVYPVGSDNFNLGFDMDNQQDMSDGLAQLFRLAVQPSTDNTKTNVNGPINEPRAKFFQCLDQHHLGDKALQMRTYINSRLQTALSSAMNDESEFTSRISFQADQCSAAAYTSLKARTENDAVKRCSFNEDGPFAASDEDVKMIQCKPDALTDHYAWFDDSSGKMQITVNKVPADYAFPSPKASRADKYTALFFHEIEHAAGIKDQDKRGLGSDDIDMCCLGDGDPEAIKKACDNVDAGNVARADSGRVKAELEVNIPLFQGLAYAFTAEIAHDVGASEAETTFGKFLSAISADNDQEQAKLAAAISSQECDEQCKTKAAQAYVGNLKTKTQNFFAVECPKIEQSQVQTRDSNAAVKICQTHLQQIGTVVDGLKVWIVRPENSDPYVVCLKPGECEAAMKVANDRIKKGLDPVNCPNPAACLAVISGGPIITAGATSGGSSGVGDPSARASTNQPPRGPASEMGAAARVASIAPPVVSPPTLAVDPISANLDPKNIAQIDLRGFVLPEEATAAQVTLPNAPLVQPRRLDVALGRPPASAEQGPSSGGSGVSSVSGVNDGRSLDLLGPPTPATPNQPVLGPQALGQPRGASAPTSAPSTAAAGPVAGVDPSRRPSGEAPSNPPTTSNPVAPTGQLGGVNESNLFANQNTGPIERNGFSSTSAAAPGLAQPTVLPRTATAATSPSGAATSPSGAATSPSGAATNKASAPTTPLRAISTVAASTGPGPGAPPAVIAGAAGSEPPKVEDPAEPAGTRLPLSPAKWAFADEVWNTAQTSRSLPVNWRPSDKVVSIWATQRKAVAICDQSGSNCRWMGAGSPNQSVKMCSNGRALSATNCPKTGAP
jgi:hypothetical protein